MGYRGASLANIFPDAPAKTAARRFADNGAERLRESVKTHTPVDTGELRESWEVRKALPGHDERGLFFEASVFTELDYAPYVEYPTGLYGPKHAKYEIRPKDPGGVLHFIGKDGKDVFAKRVMHPGSPGAHMLAKGIHDLEVALPVLSLNALEEWVLEMDAVLDREAAEGRARMAA